MHKYDLIDTNTLKTNSRSERICNILTYSLVIVVLLAVVVIIFDWKSEYVKYHHAQISVQSFSLDKIHDYVLPKDLEEEPKPRNSFCRFDCFDIYRCGHGNDRLTVYVYPLYVYMDASSGKIAATLTKEFYKILETIVNSKYFTSNPNQACLLVPSIDLLNGNSYDDTLVNRALLSLDHWNNGGENHLLFNMLPGGGNNDTAALKTDRAIIMGGYFDSWTYRQGFDVALPQMIELESAYNLKSTKLLHAPFPGSPRKYLLALTEVNVNPSKKLLLQTLASDYPSDVLLLQKCPGSEPLANARCSVMGYGSRQRHIFPHVLSKATFCLLIDDGSHMRDLLVMLALNCIPIIAIDNSIMPFEDVLDWSLASVRIRESALDSVVIRINSMSNIKVLELQMHGRWLFERYFHNIETITLTSLEILEGRIFPHRAHSYRHWNAGPSTHLSYNPLFLPLIVPKSQGFTAVILTYDRIDSLFTLIRKLSMVSSLQSILVIWNNQRKSPPHLSAFPSISKPLKIMQTQTNKLSNRFFPYAEIETEAILTIDDDIVMLTADELDFGYEVWREFPDRIVGFPSRIHVWDNTSMSWRYESEWTNEISMVLTGAAFHHKYWSHMYTYAMPGNIKEWVDEHMNCEDIAMNFLVANITNKAPIKVTPRKKFKCPECTNTEMLSADLDHMRERSACIDRFSKLYGRMTLRSVEFRADPVLFKDNFPEKLKRFNDVGSL